MKRKRKRKSKNKDIFAFDREKFFKAINKVQLQNVIQETVVPETEYAVVENILKDLELPFEKKSVKVKKKKKIFMAMKYKILPNPQKNKVRDFEDCEDFPDEILEDGQVHF